MFMGSLVFQLKKKPQSALKLRKCCLSLEIDSQTGEINAVTSFGVVHDCLDGGC